MSRSFAVLISVVGLLILTSPSAMAAGNVIHYHLVESELSSMPLDPVLGACVGYSAGTIIDERTYDVQVTEFVSGPRAGTVHLTGVVSGDFTIEPDSAYAGPVYEGSYREKVTFIGTSFDDPIVFSFSVPATATGSDGSTLKFLVHGHGVVGPNEEVHVFFAKFRCIQARPQSV